MINLRNSDQLLSLAKKQDAHNAVLIPSPPDWFISCGLGTGAPEVKSCRGLWPGTKIIGVDPDPRVVKAVRPSWPATDILLEVALSDTVEKALASFHDGPSCGTLHPRMVNDNSGTPVRVQTTTLDHLDTEYGPFNRLVLWVDAEGYDYKIVKGGEGLFKRGAILAVVVEIWTARPDLVKHYSEMRSFLFSHGLHLADILNPEWWGHNEIYLCDELTENMIKAG